MNRPHISPWVRRLHYPRAGSASRNAGAPGALPAPVPDRTPIQPPVTISRRYAALGNSGSSPMARRSGYSSLSTRPGFRPAARRAGTSAARIPVAR
jgi:hypothetical protein